MEVKEKILTVISLGVGVQSSAMALMAAKGELPMPDCAVFADTGAEPSSIYSYLEFKNRATFSYLCSAERKLNRRYYEGRRTVCISTFLY